MILSELYDTYETVANMDLTRTVADMYGTDYQPARAPSDLAKPYYMGYVPNDIFPGSMRLFRVTKPAGDEETTVIKYEEDILQNYSWFFACQRFAMGGQSVQPSLYKLTETDDGHKWTQPIAGMNSHEMQFINNIKISHYTFSGYFQLAIKAVLYDPDSDSCSWNDFNNINFNTSYEEFQDFLQNKASYTFTKQNREITFNITHYIKDEYIFRVPQSDGKEVLIYIDSYANNPKIKYDNASGFIVTTIFPMFKVETTDDNGTSANIYVNKFPNSIQNSIAISRAKRALHWFGDNPYNISSVYTNKSFVGNPNSIDIEKYMKWYETSYSANSFFYDNGKFLVYSGFGNPDGDPCIYVTIRSGIDVNDIAFLLSFQNRIYNINRDADFPSTAGYTADTITPKYTNADEPTLEFLQGDYDDIKADLRPWQLEDAAITKNDYNDTTKPTPTPPPGPSTSDEVTAPNHGAQTSLPSLSGLRLISGDAFSTFYKVSMYHIQDLGSVLTQMPDDFWAALGTATDYKESNLLDYIVSLKWYPIDITGDVVISDIQFGFNGISKVPLTSAGTSYRITNINKVFDMGKIDVPYRDNNQSFLDLEPYTTVTAYFPYIGTVSLQSNDVIGHSISCAYIIDLTTGMATAILYNEYDTIYIGTGKIGTDITVSGNDIITQSERMASSYISAATGAVNNALSIGTATAAENVSGMISAGVSSVADIATAAIGIANSKRGIPESVGSASGFGGTYTHQSPYIMVRRPAVSIPGKYGHDIGYVCNRSYSIGALTGFTVCDNPDLSGIAATTAELDMIRQILTSGFYA